MIKKYFTTVKTMAMGIVFVSMTYTIQAQVGIGTITPNSQLDVESVAVTGNTIEASHGNLANASSALWVKNSGTGYGIHAQNLNTSSNTAAMRAIQLGTGINAHGLLISMTNTTVAGTTGQFIDQLGLGLGSYINMGNAGSNSSGVYIFHAGSGDGMSIYQNGTGMGLYNEVAGNYGIYNVLNSNTLGTINLMNAGGVGEYIDLGTNDGTGVEVIAVDNVATPTAGGDVYAFNATVRTATATGAFVNGAVLAGVQSGIGHGVLVNHSGADGRNAEFNINNTANTDAAIFSVHQGQGSAILAQNQNNSIVGTVNVGDFAYTGTDVTDHVGVFGYSQPVAGWGIGVLGQGGWYGTFSLGDSSATGAKAFMIDHPEDPANKILKHFSIESNEVLNKYRGVAVFDATGKAIVSLPDYYDSVNKNPSYQLTAIGAAMPNLFIETEITNRQFVVAGGVPNKKVSWEVTAERNDPYLQQNPNKRETVILKEGERSGKYLTPELYNQPKEKGMFYNKNREKQTASKMLDKSSEKVASIRDYIHEEPIIEKPKATEEDPNETLENNPKN
ncbi:hypothetical protein Q4512_15435 [Oceanihabitans sp. 2_MG-2023]|uniref:hypothetical protein n=1 Tax=Oceanihabitans sp. 2_MG-2023 TaxID=3062661 RepID=UPI0026E3830D|nr:hypothetical protein [Oceanihabitans sp. 2_MG-2023]MDO6598316.1 hypothetical protein [Oceanihabitans sp. 2_MG-2023]